MGNKRGADPHTLKQAVQDNQRSEDPECGKNINFPAFYALESFRFVIHRQAFVHVCN